MNHDLPGPAPEVPTLDGGTPIRTTPAGLAFLAGVGFAAVPSVGPFLALLALAAGRVELQRADRWWWFAALLLGAPYALTGYAMAGLQTTAQVLAVWLIFRAGSVARQTLQGTVAPRWVGAGLVVGLTIALYAGLQQVDGLRWGTALTALDAIAWQSHPAVFGHAMLVMAALLAVVVPSERLRVVALAIGLMAVLVSGAREAAIAWLIVAVGLRFVGRRGSHGVRIAEWSLIAVMVAVVAGAGAYVGIGRSGYLTDLVRTEERPANLFRGSEMATGDWWYQLGVELSPTPATVEGQPRTGLVVRKVWTEPWSRLQQIVTLQPDTSYVLSAAWLAAEGVRPGLDGWGQLAGAERDTVMSATYVDDGDFRATAAGGVRVLSAVAEPLTDGWMRGTVVLHYDGERPIVWYTGAIVDRSEATGATVTFAELQLVASATPLPYQPGVADRGVTDLRSSRYPIWADALGAIAQRPWLGWGPGGLPRAMQELHPDETRIRPVAVHAHNLVLAAWVESGLVGLAGLLILLVLLALRAVQQRDRAMAVVLAAVLWLNFSDATLQQGALIYPLAAVLGWRAVGHRRETAMAETGPGSATAVRMVLAASDAAAGALALSAAFLVVGAFDPTMSLAAGWTAPLAYATLLWPAFAWYAGLYPGYGLVGHVELSRSVRSAAAASLALGFAAFLLPAALPLGAWELLITLLLGVVLAPTFRVLAKMLLRWMRLWGRPVVLLGTGASAAQVAQHLLSRPSVGLRPMAAFGEADGWSVAGVPVRGKLHEAWDYLSETGVRHVIVSPDAASTLSYDQVLRRADRHLRYVQFLPDLHGLPASSVVAAPLGTELALEVRNALASSFNRALKRSIDVLGSLLLLALLALPLLVVTVWVALDSAGGPLYRSPRVGRYGRGFLCIKFRTMHVDAEKRLAKMLAEDPALREEYERFHKLVDDPRVTRAGRWLRKLSIDELPQLINVLLGDMSLVGPRPYLVRELDDMGPEREVIFLARPGMTGYWQIDGRNDVTFDQRQAMEAHYVRDWSVWWDVEILFRTPVMLITRVGR